MGFKLVMQPPQTDVYRARGKRLAAELPEVNVVVADGKQRYRRFRRCLRHSAGGSAETPDEAALAAVPRRRAAGGILLS